MIYLNTIFLATLYFVLAIFPSHTNDNHLKAKNIANAQFSKISYSSSGGKSGNYESLDISPDSTIYIQGRRGVEKSRREKTLMSFWSKLTKTINLKDFGKIQSNPGHSLYDGIDITISIEKGKEKHSIVNGNEDSLNYRRIRPFTNLLEKRLGELRKRIIW